jgi:hypothetical protein
MRLLLLLTAFLFFSSCEMAHRYFITANLQSRKTKIAVKVDAIYHMPAQYIRANTSNYNDISNNSIINNFKAEIPVTVDSNKLLYFFNIQPGTTVFLEPNVIGIPAIQYVIIDGRDTIPVPEHKKIVNASGRAFRNRGSQKFLLEIE